MIAFGPVSSRRLGKSLGINNITSHKICSYSCIYCQLGHTTKKNIIRMAFYEPDILFQEVEKHLNKLDIKHKPDYLTFVANGEPTLDINLGKEIQLLKKIHIPIAVITNSSLLYHKAVQNELMDADWISVKIDSVEENTWKEVNNPYDSINLEKILNGLQKFAENYKGRLNTETMLVKGYNNSEKKLTKTASFIGSLKPEKVYLSIPIRPPAVVEIKPVTEENLNKAYQIFQKTGLNTELLTGFEGTDTGVTGNAFDDILNITAVHPLREDAIKELIGKDNADFSVIDTLIDQGVIKSLDYNGMKYYIRRYHF